MERTPQTSPTRSLPKIIIHQTFPILL
jgi:hypothetical protein